MSVSINDIVNFDTIVNEVADLFKHACYICMKHDDGSVEVLQLVEAQVKDAMKSEVITREEFMRKYAIPYEVLVKFGYIEEG